jgi:hypothetical protein
MNRVIFFLGAMLVSSWLALLVVDSAGAVPKPPPKYWSAARCERTLLREHPGIGQILCVGSGEASRCRWTNGHRVRLYSELKVFAWYRHADFSGLGMHGVEPGVVRSFTLATRARSGFDPIFHHYGDQYVGWPADFFTARIRLLGTHVPADRFRAFVAPLAAEFTRHDDTINCSRP